MAYVPTPFRRRADGEDSLPWPPGTPTASFPMSPYCPPPAVTGYQYLQNPYVQMENVPGHMSTVPVPQSMAFNPEMSETGHLNHHLQQMQPVASPMPNPVGQYHYPQPHISVLAPMPVPSPLPMQFPQHGAVHTRPEILAPRATYALRQLSNPTLDEIRRVQPMPSAQSSMVAHGTSRSDFTTLTIPDNAWPIDAMTRWINPPTWGVVKIGNIPFSVTKQEISQFLGRQAKLLRPLDGEAIHIIMERSTGKTMDCYIEFETPDDASATVDRVNSIYETGRVPRLGNRHVDVELSSQDALLKDLFPRAKRVSWRNGMPRVDPNDDPYSTGFQGLFTHEEITLAIRHAEFPQRSPFCAKCPQRTYESTISTLYKFPWYAGALYTVHDRDLLFRLANRQIIALAASIKKSHTVGLDYRLLGHLLKAGLKCPAFNERQKFTLCASSGDTSEINALPDVSKWFPFDTLVKMPDVNHGNLLDFAACLRKGPKDDLTNAEYLNKWPMDDPSISSPYGMIWFEWELEASKRKSWDDAVQYELRVIEKLMNGAQPPMRNRSQSVSSSRNATIPRNSHSSNEHQPANNANISGFSPAVPRNSHNNSCGSNSSNENNPASFDKISSSAPGGTGSHFGRRMSTSNRQDPDSQSRTSAYTPGSEKGNGSIFTFHTPNRTPRVYLGRQPIVESPTPIGTQTGVFAMDEGDLCDQFDKVL